MASDGNIDYTPWACSSSYARFLEHRQTLHYSVAPRKRGRRLLSLYVSHATLFFSSLMVHPYVYILSLLLELITNEGTKFPC